jgi:hypothetical protein
MTLSAMTTIHHHFLSCREVADFEMAEKKGLSDPHMSCTEGTMG